MRRRAVILLGLVYVFALLRPGLPSIYFALNRSYIQSELCVQKDKKDNSCKGACYLKKLVQAQEQGGQTLSLSVDKLFESEQMPTQETVFATLPPELLLLHFAATNQKACDQHIADRLVPPPWIMDHCC